MNRVIVTALALAAAINLTAQDDLLALLQDEAADNPSYAIATFKSSRIVNGHSIETRTKGVLEFEIGHRFGTLNSGHKEFWGLDQANIRLGLVYGITDDLNIGIGRSSFNKVLDGYFKYKIVRQSNTAPVTVTALGAFSRRERNPVQFYVGSNRHTYTGQLLIARKFSSDFSLQLSPTLIQRNLVLFRADANLLVAMGIGGRYKLSQRVAINAEYYPQLTEFSETYQNAFAIGFDIETGGHVFQLHVTNAQQMNEQGFIGETSAAFFDGGIHYGFNVSRVFNVGKTR